MSDNFNGLLSEEEASFLAMYEEDLEAIPSLSARDREKYLEKAKKGNDDARGLLIQDFMHTALDVTHMYAGQGILLQDLIGEGNLALVSFFKDIPGDRISSRARLKDSLDQILSCGYDKNLVAVAVESKVFGIGMESMTVGSHEFYMNYAAKNDVMCLIDTGHFHPTENVADKLSAMLLFYDKMALHVTRPVRWDSDHVVLFNDDLREIALEIVRNGAERFYIGMDYFDASINRVSAWTNGMRNMEKALLYANLAPNAQFAKLQEERNFTELMSLREEIKMLPFGDVWDEYCKRAGVLSEHEWFAECKKYEQDVLSKRA